MRVEFNYTIDDIVDVQLRLLNRSRAARAWRWRNAALTSLVAGAFLFAVIPEGIAGRTVMGTIGLLSGAAVYLALNDVIVKRRLRKWCEENAGSDKTFTCEVESGTNLFAFKFVLNTLTKTQMSGKLTPLLLRTDGATLVIAYLNAHHQDEKEAARQFLMQLS